MSNPRSTTTVLAASSLPLLLWLGGLISSGGQSAGVSPTPASYQAIPAGCCSGIAPQNMVNIIDEVNVAGSATHTAYVVPAGKSLVLQSLMAFKRSGGPGSPPSNANQDFSINLTHSGTTEIADYTIMERLEGHYATPLPGIVLPEGATLDLRHETWSANYLLRYQFIGYLVP